jgi:hypothetical protein
MRSETILAAYGAIRRDIAMMGGGILPCERLGRRYAQERHLRAELSRRLRAWDFVQQKFPGVAMTCLDVLTERERGGKE